MINLKPVIRLSHVNNQGKVNIKIRVSYQRKTRYLSTNINIEPDQFNQATGKVNDKYPDHLYINIELQKIILSYEQKLLTIPPNIDIQNLLTFLQAEKKDHDFFSLLNDKIGRFSQSGRVNTSKVCQSTGRVLERFLKRKFLHFQSIDTKFLAEFESWLIKSGVKINTISIHMRNIRAVYNQAIDEGLIGLEFYPFRRFKIKSEETMKRNITIDQVRGLKEMYLPEKLSYARDMFLLSFYLIGINFNDLYKLQKIDNAGRIVYRRAKTGKLYSIKVLPQALELIEKHRGKDSLLNCCEIYCNADNFYKNTNKFLKRIIPGLTSYYARHTWATIAANIGISKDIISHALGHNFGHKITGVYIDFDLIQVDEANQKVCSMI